MKNHLLPDPSGVILFYWRCRKTYTPAKAGGFSLEIKKGR